MNGKAQRSMEQEKCDVEEQRAFDPHVRQNSQTECKLMGETASGSPIALCMVDTDRQQVGPRPQVGGMRL